MDEEKSNGCAIVLLQRSRQVETSSVRLITEYATVNHHKHTTEKADIPDCRLCGAEEKTTSHSLGEILSNMRRTLRADFIEEACFKAENILNLLQFWRKAMG